MSSCVFCVYLFYWSRVSGQSFVNHENWALCCILYFVFYCNILLLFTFFISMLHVHLAFAIKYFLLAYLTNINTTDQPACLFTCYCTTISQTRSVLCQLFFSHARFCTAIDKRSFASLARTISNEPLETTFSRCRAKQWLDLRPSRLRSYENQRTQAPLEKYENFRHILCNFVPNCEGELFRGAKF